MSSDDLRDFGPPAPRVELVKAVVLGVSLAIGLLLSAPLLAQSPGLASAAGLAQRTVDPRLSPCILDIQQQARPYLLLAGETTELQIRISATCPGPKPPINLMLVLDASGSMLGSPTQEMKNAARKLLQRLDLPNNPSIRVGIVTFNSTARTLCQLTNESDRVLNCINKVGADGGSAIDLGIVEGLKGLRKGRSFAAGQVLYEIMVVLSDGANDEGCELVKRAARQAKGQGVLVITVCVGPDCDAACMREVASSARYFYQAADASGLSNVFDAIIDRAFNIDLRQMTVVAELPDNMSYVIDSAHPPVTRSTDQKTLEWQQSQIPADGLTITLEVLPQGSGPLPVLESTVAEYRDAHNRTGSADAVAPWIHVFGPVVRRRP